ncbi:Gfo/Idh/MocA family oxidoreductase [Sphingomonadaceae bacterium jetA1]|jgi:predicted dehydrogenase|uniref:Gfo/Idh/MocA family protein n=1 Tax=Facivitalis istanbulensis TaxID=3075838 RepID=UPI003493CEF8
MTAQIRIGIIGASAERGWAHDAHIPAIAASPDLVLKAVSTTRQETADLAARAFGVPAHATPDALVARDDVDLVVVTVKVPHHAELVTKALAAGKNVFCEWPLGNGVDESIALAERADAAGVRAFIGLQASSGPEFDHVRALVADGFVGEVLSSSIVASGANWGPAVMPFDAYVLDGASGAGMLEIPLGHTLDGVCACLGEIEYLVAETAQRRTRSAIVGTDRVQQITTPDQILVAARLRSGAPLSIHYRGGMSTGTNFLWEINGTKGDLSMTAAHGLGEMTPLSVRGGQAGQEQVPLATPEECFWAPGKPDGVARNVAQLYARIVADLRTGTRTAPDFHHAVRRHQVLAAITEAAVTGQRQYV